MFLLTKWYNQYNIINSSFHRVIKYYLLERALTSFVYLLLLLLLSHFSCVRLCVTPETETHQAPRPWDSSGENTGVGCHFLLQCMKVKSESEVTQLCPTLSDPMDCSPPGSSVHGIFQARVLEWGAIVEVTSFKYPVFRLPSCVLSVAYVHTF